MRILNNIKLFLSKAKQYLLASPAAALFFEGCVKNPFFWALSLFMGALVVMMTALFSLPTIAAMGIPICILTTLAILFASIEAPLRKWLICEASLMGSGVCNALKGTLVSRILPAFASRSWYSEITDRLTLGAIPLKNRDHLNKLKDEGYTAFLSLVEDFEQEPHLFGCPIHPEQWLKEGFNYFHLPTPDLCPVAREHIEKGIAFLHRQISKGKRVYVHCNAGVARSATIVICYLVRYHKMAVQEAVAFVKSKRWIAVDEESPALLGFTG